MAKTPEEMTNEELIDEFETQGSVSFSGSTSPEWKEYAKVRSEIIKRMIPTKVVKNEL